MITGFADVSTAVRALTAGAMDFIEKPFSMQLLLDRVAQALKLHERLLEVELQRTAILARWIRLTPREREVMDGVVSGKSNKQMALRMGLSEKTIEAHRAHLMFKMEVGSLADLVRADVMLHSHGGNRAAGASGGRAPSVPEHCQRDVPAGRGLESRVAGRAHRTVRIGGGALTALPSASRNESDGLLAPVGERRQEE